MKNSLNTRVIAGKTTGFVIGLIGFFAIPMVMPEATLMLQFGFLFWYTMMGAMIGFLGVMDSHPWFHFRMNAWFRGIFFGGFMNLALALIAYDTLEALFATASMFTGMSPFWLVLEGAIVGLIIDLIATKKGGEGPRTVIDQESIA